MNKSININGLVNSLELAKQKEALELKKLRDKIFQDCWLDSSKYAKYYYKDRFNLPFAPGHQNIFNVIDAKIKMPNGEIVPKHNKIVILSWRGCGKTSIAKTIFAKRLRTIDARFAVYAAKSHDFAALQTENIKRGMISNKREIEHFGSIKASSNALLKDTFSSKSWMTNYGSLVWPRGCGQPVRGLNFDFEGKTHRVDLAVVDDLEDKDEIGSAIYRKKTKDWILTDLCEAVPPPGVSLNWQIIYIDTLKHHDSAIQMLIDRPDWKALVLPLCDDNFNSKFPMFYTDKQCLEKYQSFASSGDADLFFQEFMCKTMDDKKAPFRQELFNHYLEHDPSFQEELRLGEIVNVVLVDPAKTMNPKSAESAIVGVGINSKRNKLYVRDVDVDKYAPDELYDHIFRMAEKLRPCSVIGIETNSLESFIIQPFKNEMLRRGLFYQVVNLDPKRAPAESADKTHGKAGRVKGLTGYYAAGCVWHNKAVCAPLETQLLQFPTPRRWDVMDCFAYIVQLLNKGNVFFHYNPESLNDKATAYRRRGDNTEQQFEELEASYEPAFKYNRIC